MQTIAEAIRPNRSAPLISATSYAIDREDQQIERHEHCQPEKYSYGIHGFMLGAAASRRYTNPLSVRADVVKAGDRLSRAAPPGSTRGWSSKIDSRTDDSPGYRGVRWRHEREPAVKEFKNMSLRTAVYIVWGVFWLYWLIAAAGAKRGACSTRFRAPGLLAIVVFLLIRVFGPHTLAIHSLAGHVAGGILLIAGLGLAVWARIYLGRNWGMPMTKKEEPELVTSGPYRFVRHPIYSGLLLAVGGTALITNVYWLIALVVVGAYFIYSAKVEEQLMTTSFPATYPAYKARTKMLVPFLL